TLWGSVRPRTYRHVERKGMAGLRSRRRAGRGVHMPRRDHDQADDDLLRAPSAARSRHPWRRLGPLAAVVLASVVLLAACGKTEEKKTPTPAATKAATTAATTTVIPPKTGSPAGSPAASPVAGSPVAGSPVAGSPVASPASSPVTLAPATIEASPA